MNRRIRSAVVVIALLTAMVPATTAHASDGGGDDGEFHGVIESLPATTGFVGDWVVSGTIVHVAVDTQIDQGDGFVAVGASVDVEGAVEAAGSITATKVDVTQDSEDDSSGIAELQGVVQTLPATDGFIGDWVVGGLTIHVTASTQIDAEDGTIAVGSFVEVKGLSESDGSITATRIDLQNDQGDNQDGCGTLTGTLDQIGRASAATWTVSGHRVSVTLRTRIVRNGHALHPGAHLRVVGHWRPNGSMKATKIVVKR